MQAPVVDVSVLLQAPVVDVSDLLQAPVVNVSDLMQAPVVKVSDLLQAPVVDVSDLLQAPVVDVSDLLQAPVSVSELWGHKEKEGGDGVRQKKRVEFSPDSKESSPPHEVRSVLCHKVRYVSALSQSQVSACHEVRYVSALSQSQVSALARSQVSARSAHQWLPFFLSLPSKTVTVIKLMNGMHSTCLPLLTNTLIIPWAL